MPKNSTQNRAGASKIEKRVEKKVEKKLKQKRFNVPPRMPSRAASSGSRMLDDALVQEKNWQQNRAVTAQSKQLGKVKKLKRKNLNYLEGLLDPFNKCEIKIPDMVSMPTSTFQLRGKLRTATDATGSYAAMIHPWFNNYYVTGTGGTAANFYSGGWTMTQSPEYAALLQQYNAVRPVSGGLRLRNTDNLQTSKGVVSAGMYQAFDHVPANYAAVQDLYYTDEFAVIDGADALWMPIHGPSDNPFLPCGTNQGGYNANLNPTWFIPSQFCNMPTTYTTTNGVGGTGITAGYQLNPQAILFGVNTSGFTVVNPAVPYASLFFAIDGATASQSFEVEWVFNFEGIPRYAGDGAGITPSPVDPIQLQAAAQVVASKEVTFTKKDSDPSFLEQVLGFVDKAGRFISNGLEVAQKVAPIIAQVGGMLI